MLDLKTVLMKILKKIFGIEVGIRSDQVVGLYDRRFITTGLSIGSGETITTYRQELLKAKIVVFFMSTSGSQFAQSIYFKTASNSFNFFVGNFSKINTNNRMSGLYYLINSSGDIVTSTFDYDGTTKINGFATYY